MPKGNPGIPKSFDQENLIPLCRSCHRSIENVSVYDINQVIKLAAGGQGSSVG